MNKGLKNLFITLTAFSGGLVTGLLLTPKSGQENRKWVSSHSKETKEWLEDKGHKIVEESEKRIDRVSKGIKKTVQDSLPDLYEATDDLTFSEDG
ncbi:MAG: YtxH domain-containing protein [Balneolaceae bacterium]